MTWPNTEHKLAEAEFFLRQLEASHKAHSAFDFYLSAFISAARSVTWIMRAECSKKPGWKEWFKAQEPDREGNKLLKAFTKIRNESQKQRPRPSTIYVLGRGGTDRMKMVRVLHEFPTEDILAVCKRYFFLLANLVADGKKKFSA